MKFLMKIPSLCALLFLLQGCVDDEISKPKSADNKLLSFTFKKEFNPSLDKDYTATIKIEKDNSNKDVNAVKVTLPAGTDVTALIASFKKSETATVSILGKIQTSGKTANDFTSPITYTVKAADETKANYTVTVTVLNITFTETADEAAQRQKIKTIYDGLMAYYDGNSQTAVRDPKNQYSTKPGFTEDSSGKRTYTVGVYKQRFKNFMLQWWKFYKAIARRPDPVENATDSERAEKGALVLSSIKKISHKPPQPKDMDKAVYDKGYSGASKGNLFTATSLYQFHETVSFNFTEGRVYDNLGSKIVIPSLGYMGHRWNGLWKTSKSVGIGYNYFNKYVAAVFIVMPTINSKSEGFQDFSAFPHGYFPIQAQVMVTNSLNANTLFKKTKFVRENNFYYGDAKGGHYTIWTLQQISSHTLTNDKSVTVTIREISESGPIVDQLTCKVGQEVKNDNGSFLRIKRTSFAGGMTISIKPKDGVLSDAAKSVVSTDKKKVFHITIDGEGITPKAGKPNAIKYRIIYYDLDH